MNPSLDHDTSLNSAIEHLRALYPQTQDLYREVCVLLFFRYGVTPTANRLYQLVRKGSMTAPASALNQFWKDLREKSRVRIEHPDLPETLRSAAGEWTATLWKAAQAAAQESLVAYQNEAQATVTQAQAQTATAEAARRIAEQESQDAQQALSEAHKRISTLEQQKAAADATTAALDAQLLKVRNECETLHQRLEAARHDFKMELDKLRADAQLAEERFRAAETRALLEIDRERNATLRLHKELESTRLSAAQVSERHRAELNTLQEHLGDLRQKNGVQEGRLDAANAARQQLLDELTLLKKQLEQSALEYATSQAETKTWREQAVQAEQAINELQEAAQAARPRRKKTQPLTSLAHSKSDVQAAQCRKAS